MKGHDRTALIDLLKHGHEDGAFLAHLWLVRRREIAKAIEGQAWDVEAVEKLFSVLGHDLVLIERQVTCEGQRVMQVLDRLVTRELALSTGLLESPRLVSSLSRAWLILEIRFRPDERGWLQDLRDRLTCLADEREIDLRGMGV